MMDGTTTRSVVDPHLWEGPNAVTMDPVGSSPSSAPNQSVSASIGPEDPGNGSPKGHDPSLASAVAGVAAPSGCSDPSAPPGHDSCRFLDSPSNETMDTAVSSTRDDPLVEICEDDDAQSFASSHGRTYPPFTAAEAHDDDLQNIIDDPHLASRNVDSPYTTSSVLTDTTEEGTSAGPVAFGAPATPVAAAIRDPSAPPKSEEKLSAPDISRMTRAPPKKEDISGHPHHNSSSSQGLSVGRSDHVSEASHLENTEVEHEDDDDEDEDVGVIAIGLPAIMIVSNDDSANEDDHRALASASPPPPSTIDEANQRLLSGVVAQNLAEQEHHTKHKDRLASLVESGAVRVVPRSPPAATPRRIIAGAAPSVTAPNNSHSGDDEMTRIKNQERERMARSVMAASNLPGGATATSPPPLSTSKPSPSVAASADAASTKNPESLEDRDAALKRAIQREMQGRSNVRPPIRSPEWVPSATSATAPTAPVKPAAAPDRKPSAHDKDDAIKQAIKKELQGHALARASSSDSAARAVTATTTNINTQEDKDAALKKAIHREMQGSAVARPTTTTTPAAAPKDDSADKDAALKRAIQREMQGTAAVRPLAAAGTPKDSLEDKDAALKKAIQHEMQGRATAQPSAARALDRVRLEQAKMQGSAAVGSRDADGPQLATPTEEAATVGAAAAWVKDTKMPVSSAAAATASSSAAAATAYATARFRQEIVKMMTEDSVETGPSLAPALAPDVAKVGAVDAASPKLPGAYHGTNAQDVTKALDDGPRLAPAAEVIDSEVPTSPAAAAAAAAAVGTAPGGMTRSLSTSSDLEAQVGIPVLPGAFAVEGIQSPNRRRRRSSTMDSGNHGSSYDSYDDDDDDSYDDEDYDENGMLRMDDFDDEHTLDPRRRRSRHVSDAELGMGDPFLHGADASTYPADAALANAFEAELHVVVEGAVINPEDEFQVDPKAVKKLRIMQGCIVCFSLAAVGIIVGIVMGFQNGQAEVSLGWTQVGSDLIGPKEEPQTFFGQSVVATSDGTRVAAAAPGLDVELELNVGEVYIMDASKMKNGSSEWVVNATLVGEDPTAMAKSSLAMSLDGKILVAGLPHLGTLGAVSTFQETAGKWETLGSNLEPYVGSVATSSDPSIWFGYAVALTADGTFMAVSAPMRDTKSSVGASVTRAGAVYCYRLVQGEWVEATVLQGVDENEMLGWSVSIQATQAGYRLAAGGPSHDAERGLARIYDSADGDSWTLATTVVGSSPLLRFGESLALNSDGATVLVVGARGSALDKGQVHVYRLDKGSAWVEDEPPLEGQEHAEGYGASVALSGDGAALAVGAPQSSLGGVGAGRVEVRTYDGQQGLWVLEGMSIQGSTGEEFGSAVMLALGGSRVVVAAPSTTFDGSIAQAGAVRVYDRDA